MTATSATSAAPRQVGRYAIYEPIATGGMATVHLGRLVGPVGFARTVAVKRLHPQYAHDPEFVSMFLDEARLAARIQHPNVVPTLDVLAAEGELLLVMDYIRGETLSLLGREHRQRGQRIPPKIVGSIVTGALQGLHAAHEAVDEAGELLGIIHRDVSPQNIIVGMDGVTRVLDFGVAKAEDRIQITQDQKVKGKLLYMSPEQLESKNVDRRTDIYAMGIVLFEALTGERMFLGDREGARLLQITRGELRMPSQVSPDLAPYDAIVRKASALEPAQRYASAREMGRALEGVQPPSSPTEVGDWVQEVAGPTISQRSKLVAEIESINRLAADDLRSALVEELRNSSRSDVSKVTLPAPPMPDRKWGLVVVGVLLLLTLGVATAILVHQRTPAAPTADKQAPSAPATTIREIVVASPPPTSTPEITPSASASSTAALSAPATAHRKTESKPDCEQPYVIDSAGHMHFRKECL